MLATVHRIDATTAAPLITSGRYCLTRMHIGDTTRRAAILAGLNVTATVLERKAALLALADAYADLNFDCGDETREQRQQRHDDSDNLAAVLRGLTPGMTTSARDVGWEYLAAAVCAIDVLTRHANAGTTPQYLYREGASTELAMAAEREHWEAEARVAAGRLALGLGGVR